MFNSGFRGKRASDGTGVVNPQDKFIQGKYPVPTIDSWTISGSDDDALDPAGGQTVLVNGGGFVSGCAVTVNGVTISPVTVVSPNQISFTSPALAGGSYSLIVYNSTGGAAILVPGLVYSSVPTWTTSAGSIGTYYETTAIDETLVATSDSAITYSLSSGSLPDGSTLYANGVISGTAPIDSSSTTYTFAVTATDAEDQDVTRTFTLTINTDVVTWVTPSSGSTIALDGTVYSQALSATDAASYSISYTANSLPTGLTLSSGTISGTPTVEGTTSTLLTATAATTNRTATNTITWVVTLNDAYFNYNTMLLSANSSIETQSFVADNSINNSQLTVVGDARVQNFNPYQPGFYSVQYNGTVNDYISIPHNSKLSIMSGDTGTFVAECFVYWNVVSASSSIMDKSGRNTISFPNWAVELDSGKNIRLQWGASGSPGTSGIGILSTGIIPVTGKWYHIAFVKSNADWSVFVNGTRATTYTGLNTANDANPAALRVGLGISGEANGAYMNGYISNVRVYNGPAGSAPYSATSTTITVPTSPFLNSTYIGAITNQSSRYLDNSSFAATITAGSGVKASTLHPFSTVYQAGTQYYSTKFDGTGDYLSVPSNSAFTLGTSDHTIEFWMYLAGSQGAYATQWKYSSAATQQATNDYYFQASSAGGATFNLLLGGGGSWAVNISNGASYTAALNIWTHIAITRSGNSFRLFANGTQVGTTVTYSGSIGAQSAAMVIGQDGSGNYMTGSISNFRVVVGQALYTSNFTPSTSPLTAVSGTQLLTCQDSTFKDNSTNNFTITGNADAKPVAVSPFTPNSYTDTQITTFGSGYFDGSGDYLSIPYNPVFYPGTSDFTVEFWMYHTNWGSAYGPGIGMGYKSTPTGGWTIYRNTVLSNGMGFRYAGQSGANMTDFFSTSVPQNNVWEHWALVRSGSTIKWYKNGVQDNSASISVNITDTDTTTLMYIGYSQQWAYNFGPGYLADVRYIKGTALYTANFLPQFTSPLSNVTNTQLLTLQTNGSHNNSVFKDSSSFNSVITRNGNATNGTFSPYGDNWSFNCNAASDNTDYVSTPSSANLRVDQGNWTLEFWLYITAWNTNNRLLDTGSNGDAAAFVVQYFNNGSISFGRPTAGTAVTTGTGVITLNRWYHIAMTSEGAGVNGRIYVDGTLQAGPTNYTNPTATSNAFNIGRNNVAASDWDGLQGYMSNLRFVSGQRLYTANFIPQTSPLLANKYSTDNSTFSNITGITQLLTLQNGSYVDNSVNNFTMTPTGSNISIQKFSPFGTVTVPKYYSVKFDGTGNISAPQDALFGFGTGDYTMECWVYPTVTTAGLRVFEATGGDNIDLNVTSTGTINYYNGSTSATSSGGLVNVNTWSHILVCRISGTVKVYVNGTLAVTQATTPNTTTRAIYIGGYTNAWFVGNISNVRIIKGQGLVTGNFTPATSPLATTTVGHTGANVASSITGTVALLTCQSNTMVDNSSNYFVITPTGTLQKPLLVSPFTPTASSVTSYSPTVFGGSMYFDGTGDYLQTATGLIHTDITQSDYTIEAWVYNQGAGAERYIFSQRGSGTGWELRINATNTVSTFFLGGTTFTSTTTIKANEWTHIAAVRIGTALSMYINGIKDSTGSGTQTNGSSAYSAYGLWLGNSTSAGGGLMLGYISDAKVTKGIGLYTSNFYPGSTPATPTTTIGTSTYSSTYLLSGTSGGVIDATRTVDLETVADAKVTNFSPYNGSYYSNYSDGNADYITAPSAAWSTLSGTFTIEGWFKWDVAPAAGNMTGVYSSGGWVLYNDGTRITPNIFGTGNIFNSTFLTTSIVLGKWYHIAVTRNSSNLMTMWVDGVDKGSTTTASAYAQGTWYIFSFNNTDCLRGNISNLRINNTCLYTSAFTPSTTPLIAISGTSLLTCQSNKFIDNSTNAITLTTNGTPKVATQNPFQVNSGLSYYFDGTGDGLLFSSGTGVVPSGAGTAFTLEFWVYPTTAVITILRCNGNGSSLGIATNSSRQLIISNTFTSDFMTTTSTLTLNQWNHVAITRTTANLYSVYIDGASAGTPVTYATSLGLQSQYYIGYNTYTGGSYVMYIADFRITNGVARTVSVPTNPYKTN